MDYRLKIFKKVAEKQSFTKAANELYITQPAVTKHINALEKELNVKLFERKGTHIKITKEGEILFNYSKKIEKLYNDLIFELNTLKHKLKGQLRIGSSSTMTQYILPQILADFKSKFKDITINVLNGNSEQIEKALINNEIDVGIVEGHSKRANFGYIEFIRDEIVLITSTKNKIYKKQEISLNDLKNIPLIIREEGSGTLEVIFYHLKKKGIGLKDLNMEMRLGNTEGIKNYILKSNSFALLSIHSILDELKKNELTIIDVKNLEIIRHFNFILLSGHQNSLTDIFIKFATNYNF